MRKLLSLKFLTEKPSKSFSLPRTHCINSHCHSFTKTPIHTPNFSHLLNSHPSSLLSPHLQWRSSAICGSLSKHFFSRTHYKGPINSFLGSRVGFLKTHLSKVKGSPWSSTHHRGCNLSRTKGVYTTTRSSWSRGYSADSVVYGLILANAAVFVLWRVLPRDFMYRNCTISVDNFKSGRIHTLLTSAFSHIDLEHLGSNMIGLYFFGSSLGSVFGPEYLLKLYVTGAVVGSIFYLMHHSYLTATSKSQGIFYRNPSKTPGLGASGAVNAIMLLDIFLFPRKTLMLDFIIPVPAILLGIFLVGKDVLRILEGDEQISGSAHLGGAVVAAVAWLRLRGKLRF